MSLIPDYHCDVVDFRCTRCAKEFSPTDPLPILRRCPSGSDPLPSKKSLACIHRTRSGIRLVEADGCCGAKQTLYVDACTIHGECTKGREIPGVKSCNGCEEIEAPQDPPPPAAKDHP